MKRGQRSTRTYLVHWLASAMPVSIAMEISDQHYSSSLMSYPQCLVVHSQMRCKWFSAGAEVTPLRFSARGTAPPQPLRMQVPHGGSRFIPISLKGGELVPQAQHLPFCMLHGNLFSFVFLLKGRQFLQSSSTTLLPLTLVML